MCEFRGQRRKLRKNKGGRRRKEIRRRRKIRRTKKIRRRKRERRGRKEGMVKAKNTVIRDGVKKKVSKMVRV